MDMDLGSPPPIRRTRAALAEIPVRLGRVVLTPTVRETRGVLTPIRDDNNTFLGSPEVLPNSFLSPTPSPDELVIQQRGRRRLPVNWSPDIDARKNSTFRSSIRTPPKLDVSHLSPSKLGVQTRSTPRKRLLLGDSERPALSPEKIDFSDLSTPQKIRTSVNVGKSSPMNPKRPKLDTHIEHKGPIDLALKGLSHAQVIELFKNVFQKHPELESEVRSQLPQPDLRPLEEKLNSLKSLIFKSLPTSRLTSKTDSPAYSRVATHVVNFKRCVIEQGKTLVESQHWHSVLDYVFLAWSYVRTTPIWDNHPHNAPRRQCFKSLTSFCMSALKKGCFDNSLLHEVLEKLQGLVADSEEIQCCIQYIQAQTSSCYV